MKYTDFLLLLTEPQIVKEAGKKRLLFKLHLPGIFEEPIPSEYDVRQLDDLKQAVIAPGATWKEVSALGIALTAALLPDKVWTELNKQITQAQAGQQGVRVRLMLSGSELNNVPWEFLLFNRGGGEVKPTDFLALMPNVSIVRHKATPLPVWSIRATHPALLMAALASPNDLPKLNIEKEQSIVKQAVAQNPHLQLAITTAAKRSDLPDKSHPAHLFHFAGHGKFEPIPSTTAGQFEGKASLILEDEYHDPDELDADLLALQLREAGVRVAVLGACLTAQRDDKNAWSSVAEALLKAELGAVVGMQFPVLDSSATRFAEQFYNALLSGLTIDEAVATARVAIATADDARGWGTPTLYLRAPDGVIFPEYEAEPSLEAVRKQARVDVSIAIKNLAGKATGVKSKTMTSGEVAIVMTADTVTGDMVAADIGNLGGGAVSAKQEIGVVGKGGNVIGAKFGSLGGGVDKSTGRGLAAGSNVEVSVRNNEGKVVGEQRANTVIERVDKIEIRNEPDARFTHINNPQIEEKIRVDAAAPNEVVVGEIFDLAVAIRQPDSPVLAFDDLSRHFSAKGTTFRSDPEEVVRYRVAVSASNCEIYGRSEYVFLLKPCRDSEVVFFQLSAKKPGRLSILVQAYQDDDNLAAMTRVQLIAQIEAAR